MILLSQTVLFLTNLLEPWIVLLAHSVNLVRVSLENGISEIVQALVPGLVLLPQILVQTPNFTLGIGLVFPSGILAFLVVSGIVRIVRRAQYAAQAVDAGRVRLSETLRALGKQLYGQQLIIAFDRWFWTGIAGFLESLWPFFVERPFLYSIPLIKDSLRAIGLRILYALAPIVRFIRGLVGKSGKESLQQELLGLMDQGQAHELGKMPEDLAACFTADLPGSWTILDSWKETTDTAIDRWNRGTYGNLLIIGNAGSGKTRMREEVGKRFSHPIYLLSPENRNHPQESRFIDDLAALTDDELSELPHQMVVVDNLELFFLRTPGGFAELQKILLVTERTARRIFWVLTTSEPFYNFTRLIFPFDTFFPFRVQLHSLDGQRIREIYDSRLGSAGYTYKIIPSKSMYKTIVAMKRRHLLDEKDGANFVKKLYFESLLEKGGANFSFLNYYMTRSFVAVHGRVATFKEPQILDVAFVGSFSQSVLFCLQALYLHRSLSSNELSEILAISLDEATLNLGILRGTGIALVTNGSYRINPQLFEPVYEVLRKKNLYF